MNCEYWGFKSTQWLTSNGYYNRILMISYFNLPKQNLTRILTFLSTRKSIPLQIDTNNPFNARIEFVVNAQPLTPKKEDTQWQQYHFELKQNHFQQPDKYICMFGEEQN